MAVFAVRPYVWLLKKETRELVAARAWWVLLLAMGPLVGVTFISAVRTYGEASGLNGTTAGVGEAFSPLIGIWAPTFSACEVAAVFLLCSWRSARGGRPQSGALKIEMQYPDVRFRAHVVQLIVPFVCDRRVSRDGRRRAVGKATAEHLRAGSRRSFATCSPPFTIAIAAATAAA
jgi:hypothetical protein